MRTSLLTIFFLSLFLVMAQPAWASYFYLVPNSSSVDKDSTFTVQVKLNTQDEAINAVSAYLSFPKDKLEAISIEPNTQLLPIEAENQVENDKIKISRANFSSVDGDVTIATISFKTKALGSAQIEFIPGSAVPRTSDSSDSLNLDLSRGATFQIKSDGSPESTTNPTPKSSDRKPIRCQEKEAPNKSRLNVIANSFSDNAARLDTIFALVDDYYTNQLLTSGKSLTSYIDQKEQVNSKRIQALEKLNAFKNNTASWNCGLKNPKESLIEIKNESQSTRSALREYRESLKSLIKNLRNIK